MIEAIKAARSAANDKLQVTRAVHPEVATETNATGAHNRPPPSVSTQDPVQGDPLGGAFLSLWRLPTVIDLNLWQ